MVAVWQVRIAIADHRLRQAAAARRDEATKGGSEIVQSRVEVSGQPVRLMPRPVFLVGREELLDELDDALGKGEGPQVAALYGLGGSGKTSTSLEYAYRNLGGFGIVWQFASEEPAALAAGFGELAAQLGVRRALEGSDPVVQVHAALATYASRWLLLFDNAPSRAAIESALPPAGRGCVLVTSQDPAWPGSHRLEVPTLDIETAAVFLQSRTGDGDLSAARELAEELGGPPLALEQAAAYMDACGYGIVEYLELFREERPGLLARGEAAGHDKRVASTWQLAFDRLSQDTPEAIALLRLLACCAPEQIPVRLLLRSGADISALPTELVPLLDSPLVVNDALAALRRYSLIGPLQDDAVSVHRLVQAVTMDSLPAELADAWRKAARAIVSAALPPEPDQPETWPEYATLLPHAEVALRLIDDGMSQVARFLGESGNYAAARDLSGRLATERETVLGPEHPGTLASLHESALWTGHGGNNAAARDQFALLLPVQERVLGSEHPDTLAVRYELARWTGRSGGPVAARDLLAAALPVYERVLGSEYPDTLETRRELAHWTGWAGDAAAARDQHAAVLLIQERVLGPENPKALWTRGPLAKWTGTTGDAVAARNQFAVLLPILERILGPEHPFTLEACMALAEWTGYVGDAVAARDQLTVLLPIIERVFGPTHLECFENRAMLAHWTGETGDVVAVRDQLTVVLPYYERWLGLENPDTLRMRVHLAHWIGKAGDAVAARDQLAVVLAIQERVIGLEHFDILETRARLTEWTQKATSIESR